MIQVHHGNCLEVLAGIPDASVHCCITSPPYYALRDYGIRPCQWPEVTFKPMIGVPEVTIPAMECVHGLEPGIMAFVAHEVAIFRQVFRVLRPDGVLWVNLGDTYTNSGGLGVGGNISRQNRAHKQRAIRCGLEPGFHSKDKFATPWRVAMALQADGWILRQDVIWEKPCPVPESAKDRCTNAHEFVFILAKSRRYYWDRSAMLEAASGTAHPRSKVPASWGRGDEPRNAVLMQTQENRDRRQGRRSTKVAKPGSGVRSNESFDLAVTQVVERRNRRSVWKIAPEPSSIPHFAMFPMKLARLCLLAACPPGGTVLDPFAGSGTVGRVAAETGRRGILIEASERYVGYIRERLMVTPELGLQ